MARNLQPLGQSVNFFVSFGSDRGDDGRCAIGLGLARRSIIIDWSGPGPGSGMMPRTQVDFVGTGGGFGFRKKSRGKLGRQMRVAIIKRRTRAVPPPAKPFRLLASGIDSLASGNSSCSAGDGGEHNEPGSKEPTTI